MKRRSLFLAIATAVLVAGLGALDAKAGPVPLPTTLDQLLVPGATVVTGLEPDTYSNFAYSPTPMGSPPTAANVSVTAFGPVGNESGITFGGAFAAAPGATVDYAISYTITAPAGSVINDALLSATFNLPPGSTGSVSIGESLFNAANGAFLGQLQVSNTSTSTSSSSRA